MVAGSNPRACRACRACRAAAAFTRDVAPCRCSYRKDAPFVDVTKLIPDANPVLPHVSNPHDFEWDVLDQFGNDCFSASDVAQRIPLHRAFREACNAASALHPEFQKVGTFQNGDYVRLEGRDVVVSRVTIRSCTYACACVRVRVVKPKW